MAIITCAEKSVFEGFHLPLAVYLRHIEETQGFRAPMRGKNKAGGLEGFAERCIERHTENQIIQHYKEVSDAVLGYYRRGHFGTLVVGI